MRITKEIHKLARVGAGGVGAEGSKHTWEVLFELRYKGKRFQAEEDA